MTTPMKNAVHALAAAALSAATLAPAIASAQDEIVVSPTRAMEEWRADVSRDLGRNLDRAERWAKYNPEPGIVQVRFSLDENGRPVDMETYRSSGNVSTDRAARWAVRHLSDLDQAPTRVSANTTFQANIIFAETRAQQEDFAEKLAWIEKNRLARSSSERDVIALGS